MIHRTTIRLLSLALAVAVAHAAEPPESRNPLGFRADDAAGQLQREATFDSYLDAKNLEQWMRQMTTRPHHAGSPKAKENADFIAGLFRSWGYQTEIETFHVLFPTPKTRELQLLRPYPITLPLTEQIIGTDAVAEALRAEAFGPGGAHTVVEMTIARRSAAGGQNSVAGEPQDYNTCAPRVTAPAPGDAALPGQRQPVTFTITPWPVMLCWTLT